MQPPAGAIPTFYVQSLPELGRRLQEAGQTSTTQAAQLTSSNASSAQAAQIGASAQQQQQHGLSMGWMAKLAAGQPLPAAGEMEWASVRPSFG